LAGRGRSFHRGVRDAVLMWLERAGWCGCVKITSRSCGQSCFSAAHTGRWPPRGHWSRPSAPGACCCVAVVGIRPESRHRVRGRSTVVVDPRHSIQLGPAGIGPASRRVWKWAHITALRHPGSGRLGRLAAAGARRSLVLSRAPSRSRSRRSRLRRSRIRQPAWSRPVVWTVSVWTWLRECTTSSTAGSSASGGHSATSTGCQPSVGAAAMLAASETATPSRNATDSASRARVVVVLDRGRTGPRPAGTTSPSIDSG
jgi:hypothetical protein